MSKSVFLLSQLSDSQAIIQPLHNSSLSIKYLFLKIIHYMLEGTLPDHRLTT